jgi:hypothetical protein
VPDFRNEEDGGEEEEMKNMKSATKREKSFIA